MRFAPFCAVWHRPIRWRAELLSATGARRDKFVRHQEKSCVGTVRVCALFGLRCRQNRWACGGDNQPPRQRTLGLQARTLRLDRFCGQSRSVARTAANGVRLGQSQRHGGNQWACGLHRLGQRGLPSKVSSTIRPWQACSTTLTTKNISRLSG